MPIDAQICFNQVFFCRSVPPELLRSFFCFVSFFVCSHSLPLPYNYRAQLPPDCIELNFLSPTEHSPRVPLTHSCICTLSFFNSSLRHSLFDITGLYLAYSLHSFIHYHIGFIKPRSSMDVPTQFPFNFHQPSLLISRFDSFKFHSLFCGCLLIYTFTHSHLS